MLLMRVKSPIPFGLAVIVLGLMMSLPTLASEVSSDPIDLSVISVQQGKTFTVRFTGSGRIRAVSGATLGHDILFSRIGSDESSSAWRAFVGVDVRTSVGTHEVTVTVEKEGGAVLPLLPRPVERQEFITSIQVTPGNFPAQRVKLPPKASKLLDPKLLKHDQDRLEAAMASAYKNEEIAPNVPQGIAGPFQTPLAKYIVTTRFGEHRVFNNQEFGFHRGLDMAAPMGTPIKAALPGIVVMSEKLYAHGHSVMIAHGEGVFTLYVHMSQRDVDVGEPIDRGGLVGKVGSTGISSGPHLHLGMMVHGVRVDPMQWMKGGLLSGSNANQSE